MVVKGSQATLTHQSLISRGMQEKPGIMPIGAQASRILSLPISSAQQPLTQQPGQVSKLTILFV